MQLLTPISLFLAGLAIPVILLYMLKLRRKQTPVSSTFLWQQLLREQQANAPWQKLKRNLLLILQLLILAALVFALARPALQIPTVANGSVIVLLDASASMNATDVSPSRFDSAKDSVNAIINGLNPASSLTLILVGETPEILIASETDSAALKAALNKAKATQGAADWEAAFALAAGATRSDAIESTILIVSDGGLPESGLPALPGEVQFLPIGKSADNLAISALALRRGTIAPELFVQVNNYSAETKSVLLSLYFNDTLFSAEQITLQAKSSAGMTLDNIQDAAGVYKAEITSAQNQPPDALTLDNTAFAVYQTSASRKVLLVSKGNLFLEQALASLPNIQAFRALPAADGSLQISKDPFDLYVFDGIIPEQIPNGNLLFINPPSNPYFEVGGTLEQINSAEVSQHPLTQYLDWSNVHILKAKQVKLPDWAEALVQTNDSPLVFAGQTDGQRIASINFDLRESDLPLQIAFPILFSNLTNYLVPPSAFDATQALAPSQSLQIIPPPGTEQIVIASPSGTGYTYANEAGGLKFTKTDELGYYAVNFISKDSTSAEYFAVNLFNAAESNITPKDAIQIGQAKITHAVSEKIGQYELWKWLALLAILILMIEWQVYHRRQIFPKRIVKASVNR
ncbi:MAG: BatA and WFA domain-containing protein [Anaerolineales bacterium]|nr:BatA and WFA domain-containing protein [Anaerolineales bacterium]